MHFEKIRPTHEKTALAALASVIALTLQLPAQSPSPSPSATLATATVTIEPQNADASSYLTVGLHMENEAGRDIGYGIATFQHPSADLALVFDKIPKNELSHLTLKIDALPQFSKPSDHWDLKYAAHFTFSDGSQQDLRGGETVMLNDAHRSHTARLELNLPK